MGDTPHLADPAKTVMDGAVSNPDQFLPVYNDEGEVDLDGVLEQMDPRVREAILKLEREIEADPSLLDQDKLQDHLMERYQNPLGYRGFEEGGNTHGTDLHLSDLHAYTSISKHDSRSHGSPTLLAGPTSSESDQFFYHYVQGVPEAPCAAEVAAVAAAFIAARHACTGVISWTPPGRLRYTAAMAAYVVAAFVATNCIGELSA